MIAVLDGPQPLAGRSMAVFGKRGSRFDEAL